MTRATRDLLAYLDRVEPQLSKLTHFEMLDVSPEATMMEIQKAYHLVAVRMHPDHHRAHLNAEQYERLNIVYGRITEAYRCLRNPNERKQYMQRLQTSARPKGANTEQAAIDLLPVKAQRLYRRALVALRTGDKGSAMLNLKMALRAAPNSSLLRDKLRQLRPK